MIRMLKSLGAYYMRLVDLGDHSNYLRFTWEKGKTTGIFLYMSQNLCGLSIIAMQRSIVARRKTKNEVILDIYPLRKKEILIYELFLVIMCQESW